MPPIRTPRSAGVCRPGRTAEVTEGARGGGGDSSARSSRPDQDGPDVACPSDRRAKYVALTREGARLIRQLFPSHARVLTKAMSGLSRSEQTEAARLLRSLGRAAAGGGLPTSPNTIRKNTDGRREPAGARPAQSA